MARANNVENRKTRPIFEMVLEIHNAGDRVFLRSILDAEKIDYFIQGRRLRRIFSTRCPCDLMVRQDQMEKVRELLESFAAVACIRGLNKDDGEDPWQEIILEPHMRFTFEATIDQICHQDEGLRPEKGRDALCRSRRRTDPSLPIVRGNTPRERFPFAPASANPDQPPPHLRAAECARLARYVRSPSGYSPETSRSRHPRSIRNRRLAAGETADTAKLVLERFRF